MLTDYEYFVRETKIKLIEGNVSEERAVINIGIRNKVDGTIAASPLTDFIIKHYESAGSRLNTSKAPADLIVRFLNFVNLKIEENDMDFKELRHLGIRGLNLQHGSRFLTHQAITKGNKRETIKYYENYLSDFYLFLHTQGLTNGYSIINGKVMTRYGEREKRYVNFNDAPEPPIRPTKNQVQQSFKKLKDFGGNRLTMVSEFIGVANSLYPEIALGIAFMFYGGLRRGEVINLTRDSVRYKQNSHCIVEIRNRTMLLFPHIKNNSKNQVKIERDQIILTNPIIDALYESQLKFLSKRKANNPNALFVNRDGNPITGKSFEDKFNKIRVEYEKVLSRKLDRRADYEYIKGVRWSNHIGRGVFTNFLLSIGTPLTEVSIARGDSSPESLLAYIEELNAQAALRKGSEIIAEIYKDYKERIAEEKINGTAISKAFEKGVSTLAPQYISTFKELYTKIV
ncbi:site-specific integrase [Sporosarcina sp. G11-34]|uniref:site-specific integrase n=1 Tax=Sporosarcina sp. G11-34 TaxID=2849605 RepID=UPI0022A9F419|nr:site-specific integrase [Sporosarcina sp. G11-34]MCZ2259409.1 site-specific integrase [Sporosarcina sp. G11-34]